MSEIIKILLFKSQNDKDDIQFRMDTISSICLMIGVYNNVNIIIDSINSIQNGLFIMVLNQLFIPTIPQFMNDKLIRCLVVGMCKMFSENNNIIDNNVIKNATASLLILLLNSEVKLSEMKEFIENEIENNDSMEDIEYNSNYSKLIYAKFNEITLFPGLPDTRKIFSNFLSKLISENKIEVVPEVKEYLSRYPPN